MGADQLPIKAGYEVGYAKPPAEQLRPKIARRRAQWQKYQGWPGVTDLVAGFDGQLVAAHQAALLPSSTPNRASARSSKL